jgi:protocatechuate 3,4-dioxygenase beta subunit
VLLLICYGILAVGFLGWWLVGLVQLWLLMRATVPAPKGVHGLLQPISGPAAARVRLLTSDRITVPLTFGWLRPIIVLPTALCHAGQEAALRYCLAHEWSHIERRDIWSWHLATLAQALFFYQPLFWWLRRQLRLCQDYLADARAVQQAAAAVDYAAYLVSLAQRRLGNSVPAALGIGDRHSNLYRRVLMLLNTRHPLEQHCRGRWSAACALGILALLAVVAGVRLDAAPVEDQKKPAKQESGKGTAIPYTGRVFDKDTGKGIANASVTVRRTSYGDPKGQRTLEESKHKTNAEGKYGFIIPPEQAAERYLYIELDVSAPGYAPRSHFGYAFSMIQKNEKLGGRPFFENVDLRPAAEITGTVETPEGKPAAGIKVLAYSNTSKRTEEFEYGSFADTRTDAAGRFRLWLITPGPAVFWILPEQYAPSTHVIKDPTRRGDQGRFLLNPGLVLKGKVVNVAGKPLPGLFVEIRKRGGIEDFNLPVADHISRTASTNDQGEFTAAPLPAGEYEVMPQEHGYDPAKDNNRSETRPVPGVFLRQRVALKGDQAPDALEVRAVPHVVIEAQYYDSKGKKTRGHAGHMFGRIGKNDYWFGEGKMDMDGKMTLLVPHGLNEARLSLMTNEHGALRWRRGKDGPMSMQHEIELGTLNDHITDLEITRYVAPILIIGAVEKGGAPLKTFQAKVEYEPGRGPEKRGTFVNGVQGDVYLEKQEDGRWRTSQLQPDEELSVTVSAEGYRPRTEKIKVAEGVTKELKVELEKQAVPSKGKGK